MNDKTEFLSLIILAVIIGQLILTLSIGMGPGTNPVEIYVRNFSSMASLLIIAFLLYIYHCCMNPFSGNSYLKHMKAATLILSVASLVKAFISAIYAISYIDTANIVLFYYFGETLVWAAVALFAIVYYKRLKR